MLVNLLCLAFFLFRYISLPCCATISTRYYYHNYYFLLNYLILATLQLARKISILFDSLPYLEEKQTFFYSVFVQPSLLLPTTVISNYRNI